MNTEELEKLAVEFADCVGQQSDCIRKGDAKKGNKFADRYTAIIGKLLGFGDAGRDALVPLMRHQRVDVRVKAAALLLRYRHDDAKAVLEAAVASRDFAALGAEQTLKRWSDGTWNLDGKPNA